MPSARVVFIEGEEPRMLRAAVSLAQAQSCRPILIGRPSAIRTAAGRAGLDVSGMEWLDPHDAALRGRLVDDFESHSGQAVSDVSLDRASYGAMLVRAGWAEAAIGGADVSSADMLRAGLRFIGRSEDRTTVSGAILLDTQRPEVGSAGTLAFADAVVTPQPEIDQLVDIAAATAQTWRSLMRSEPHIAFLSFSTKGSSKSSFAHKARRAADLFRQRFPGEVADGEIQFDAAVSKSVAGRKSAAGPVAGSANVFVFPNLDAANIAYKVAEQVGGARARAVLQGLALPFADVSRGCSVDDIVTTVGMLLCTSLQRQTAAARHSLEA